MSVTAIVTAHKRVEETLTTLRRLTECRPEPAEILVHVDDNQAGFAALIRARYPDVKVLLSQFNIGPGGARNALLAASQHPIVASFDDDSYPLDRDYFARLEELFARFPQAAIACAAVIHRNETVEPASARAEWVADFIGCGCAYQKERLSGLGWYVPLPLAYGMEEADLSLRVFEKGGRVLRSASLRVFHDTNLSHHSGSAITAASLANIALMCFLRFPPVLWPLGVGQVLSRVRWLLAHRRFSGIVPGLVSIPSHLYRYREHRRTVHAGAVLGYLRLRRAPVTIPAGLVDAPAKLGVRAS